MSVRKEEKKRIKKGKKRDGASSRGLSFRAIICSILLSLPRPD
jgi:hypothetical protein